MPAVNHFGLLKYAKAWLWLILLASCLVRSANDVLLEQIRLQYGEAAGRRIADWEALIEKGRGLPDQERLALTNHFFNAKILFIDDIVHWHQDDYWATPVEFLATGAGDCEDFAIAKYFTLKKMGINENKMRITYVKAYKLNQAHMVLTYFEHPKAVPLVLDNLVDEIRPASQRRDLIPVYSFNGDGLWLAKTEGAGKRLGNAGRLNLWQDLQQRMQEGMH